MPPPRPPPPQVNKTSQQPTTTTMEILRNIKRQALHNNNTMIDDADIPFPIPGAPYRWVFPDDLQPMQDLATMYTSIDYMYNVYIWYAFIQVRGGWVGGGHLVCLHTG